MNILLVFASTHGHTVRIAQRIAVVLRREGHHVSVRRIDQAPDRLDRWDAVVVGGSLHFADHQPELVSWAHEHHRELAERPNAFFSVSLSAAETTPKARAAVRECIDRFVEDTEWDPDISVPIAGCLQYLEYDPATRIAIRAKMHLHGKPVDTSRDHEMTDWDAVERFATGFAGRVGRRTAVAA
jgi:menaquinone-dependent protoporphyrinogen oxidase